MWRDLRVLAVVPARGGSKGIPRKNLQLLGGRSLVRHAIDLAKTVDLLDLVVLSTDDQEIAEEGRRAGIEVPALRPEYLATDHATGHAVWRHAHLEAETRAGTQFHLSILLQPTSPFRDQSDVTRCIATLIEGNFDAVTTVSPTPSHFAPEKTMTLDDSGHLRPYLGDGFQSTRQLIPTYHHLNGACYAARRPVVLEAENVFGPNTGAVIMEGPMVNIDEPFDLEVARWLWEKLDL